MEKVCIVIPAYNEENRIGNTLRIYSLFFEGISKKTGFKYEIIVVLNGCKDNTLGVVKEYKKINDKINFLDFATAGKGFAITKGFIYAINKNFDLIGFVDADMATKPEDFYFLVTKLKENRNYQGVIASRWVKNSVIVTPQTLLRKITSRGFNFIVKSLLLLPYSDTQCGAKIFRKNALNKVIDKIGMSEWAYDVELLYQLKKNGFKVKDYPTVWEDKRGSKLDLKKVPFKMFASVVRLRIIHSPFNSIVKFYDKLPAHRKIHNW